MPSNEETNVLDSKEVQKKKILYYYKFHIHMSFLTLADI